MSDPTDPNRNPRRDFYVGLTVMCALSILAALVLTFGGVKRYFQGGYTVTVRLPIAQGLSQGSTATLAGVPVGTVESVRNQTRPDGTMGVDVVVKVNEDVDLPANTRVDLKEQILGGTSRIIFMVDTQPAAGQTGSLPKNGTAIIDGTRSNLAIDIVNGIKGTLDQTMGTLAQDTHEMVVSIKHAADAMADTLAQQDPNKVKNGEVKPNLATVVVRMNAFVEHADEVVSDPQLRADLKATLASARKTADEGSAAIHDLKIRLNEVSDKASVTLDKAGKAVEESSGEIKRTAAATRETLTKMQGSVSELEKKYGKLADALNETTGKANTILDGINQGEGTAGKLVRDPALYDNLNDATLRLQTAIEDIRLLLEKLKKEGVQLKVGL